MDLKTPALRFVVDRKHCKTTIALFHSSSVACMGLKHLICFQSETSGPLLFFSRRVHNRNPAIDIPTLPYLSVGRLVRLVMHCFATIYQDLINYDLLKILFVEK